MAKREDFPAPPFPKQSQEPPGLSGGMRPQPDYGDDSYEGHGRLLDKKVLLTGGDSGIGRAVAIAFAREGADLVISYLSEDEDAEETKRLVEDAGRRCVLVAGDIGDAAHCRSLVAQTVKAFGRIDVLVNNAAHQSTFRTIEEIEDEEWERTFAVNISAMFYITKAAVAHMPKGSSIINTASINADNPNPILLAYATTKGAIENFSAGLAQMLAERGIRAARIHDPARPDDSALTVDERARLETLDRFDILDTPREESFDRVARMVRRVLDVPVAIVSFIDAHRQWYKACYGLGVDEQDKETTFCRMVLADRAPVVVADASTDDRVRDNPHVLAREGVRFYMGVPLMTRDGHILGTLCVIDYRPRQPEPGDVEILTDFASVVMDELELRQAAAIDPMTGAMSRKAFRSQVARAMALSIRDHSKLTVLAVDLDYFKAVNDTYGHATGDAVLRSVVTAAKAELRKSDDIGRMGGEEFAMLLPSADLPRGLEVAERIRARIERTPVEVDGAVVHITTSIGVAAGSSGDSVDEVLKHADDALYLAKNRGRNQVLAWHPPADAPRLHLRRVLKGGTLLFNGGTSSFDCTIRGLSDDGAGIDVYTSVGIPDDVELRITGEAFRKNGRVVGRTDRHLELAFV